MNKADACLEHIDEGENARVVMSHVTVIIIANVVSDNDALRRAWLPSLEEREVRSEPEDFVDALASPRGAFKVLLRADLQRNDFALL